MKLFPCNLNNESVYAKPYYRWRDRTIQAWRRLTWRILPAAYAAYDGLAAGVQRDVLPFDSLQLQKCPSYVATVIKDSSRHTRK